jgi:hypothetical protein
MEKRTLVHRSISAICLIAGAVIAGLALASVSATRVVAMLLAGAWLILGGAAWWESLKHHPTRRIYQVLPPPTYTRDRQYPRSHVVIIENGPQNPVG